MSEVLESSPPRASERSPTASAPPRARGASWWWSGLRPLVLRLHFYVSLFVGPFLLVAALTGLAYTLTPQLERLHRGPGRRRTAPAGA